MICSFNLTYITYVKHRVQVVLSHVFVLIHLVY